ncbi:MAG: nucleoside triphosphate pyrophosphohydrolase [Gemmatimonadales bacterium]|nr:MAG: nucleoside triphosphate pyrophosphohydrolase [Gemmatimonadales bacterium]
MQESSALGRVVELVRELRRRCPWDAAQTPQTLRPYLVEEALELDHALGKQDSESIREELGDLLLHVAFQIVLAEEAGAFGTEDLVRTVERKMWRRHPHLFPAAAAGASENASGDKRPASWEHAKAPERQEGAPGYGVLDGLPPNLPALLMAYRLQERAAGVGFDWSDPRGPLDKIREELGELEAELSATAPTKERTGRLSHEIGDILFAVVNLARKLDLDPRAALEDANRRFADRFRHMERLAAERGIDISTAGLETLDRLWEETKQDAQ